MNLSELFMKIAKEMKNDHFFGIPGSGVPLDLMDSGKNIDLHFINVAHESTAAIAAGTYGLIKESGIDAQLISPKQVDLVRECKWLPLISLARVL